MSERAHGVEQVGDVAGTGGAAGGELVGRGIGVAERHDDARVRRASRSRRGRRAARARSSPATRRRRATTRPRRPPTAPPTWPSGCAPLRAGDSIGPSRCSPSGTAPEPRGTSAATASSGPLADVGRARDDRRQERRHAVPGRRRASSAMRVGCRGDVDAVGAVDLQVDEAGRSTHRGVDVDGAAAPTPRRRSAVLDHDGRRSTTPSGDRRCRRRSSRRAQPFGARRARRRGCRAAPRPGTTPRRAGRPSSSSIGDVAARRVQLGHDVLAEAGGLGHPAAEGDDVDIERHRRTVVPPRRRTAATSRRRVRIGVDGAPGRRRPRRSRSARTRRRRRARTSGCARSRPPPPVAPRHSRPPSTKPAAMPVPTLT